MVAGVIVVTRRSAVGDDEGKMMGEEPVILAEAGWV